MHVNYIYISLKVFVGAQTVQEAVLHLFLKPDCSQSLRVAYNVETGTGIFILRRHFENPVLLFWKFKNMKYSSHVDSKNLCTLKGLKEA